MNADKIDYTYLDTWTAEARGKFEYYRDQEKKLREEAHENELSAATFEAWMDSDLVESLKSHKNDAKAYRAEAILKLKQAHMKPRITLWLVIIS